MTTRAAIEFLQGRGPASSQVLVALHQELASPSTVKRILEAARRGAGLAKNVAVRGRALREIIKDPGFDWGAGKPGPRGEAGGGDDGGGGEADGAGVAGEVQRKAGPGPGEHGAPAQAAALHRASQDPHEPVGDGIRQRVEEVTGRDLGGVKIHRGPGSAAAAAAVGARAYTVGQDVHFGAGQFRPGTADGDHLIAHELAHTAQQTGRPATTSAPQSKPLLSRPGDSAELEADRVADVVVSGAPGARVAISAPPAAAAVQRREDLHAGAHVPDATQQADIQSALHPATATAPGVAPAAWDGAATGTTVSPTAQAARDALRTELTAALTSHLDRAMVGIRAEMARPVMPMASFEGAGAAAKSSVDARFGRYASAGVLTAPQRHGRNTHRFRASGAGQNLLDATSVTDRATGGLPIDANDLANWIAESDSAAQAATGTHHFDPRRSTAEGTFLRSEILNPFVAARLADLELYDRFGFGLANQGTGQILMSPRVRSSLPATPGAHGRPSDAERATLWDAWRLLVHEYIHTLEHPASQSNPGSNRTISEGFCEMFTKEVLLAALPGAARNVALRTRIEGRDNGVPSDDIVGGPYSTPPDYAQYLTAAERIRDTILGGGAGGENAVRGAYFHGHVEYLGMNPDGTLITPVPVSDRDLITVPPGVTTTAALAAASRVPATEISAANVGVALTPTLPARVHVPGCRDHIVVEASDGTNTDQESRRQIARQNGISPGRLQAANPGVNFRSLSAGQRLLIPRH